MRPLHSIKMKPRTTSLTSGEDNVTAGTSLRAIALVRALSPVTKSSQFSDVNEMTKAHYQLKDRSVYN